MGAVEQGITAKLTAAFTPTHLCVLNESYKHNVPPGAETHFKVIVVSERFDGVKLIERHRMINGCLEDELKGPVHALAITAKTPAQWESAGGDGQAVEGTPACAGGDGAARRKHEESGAQGT
eukprot:Hpha_TRINITY_DN23186_c0_g1::TRINITY_DN23186_c0_g1_i1::g.29497::m.29497/K05527/bolA; BolA family transcriptional regulator, general stress-responsive regulator